MEINEYIIQLRDEGKSWHEVATLVNHKFDTSLNGESARTRFRRKTANTYKEGDMPRKKPSELVGEDRKVKRLETSKKVTDKKYQEALKEIEILEKQRDAVKAIKEVSTHTIQPKKRSGDSESTVVVLASDWHCEESIDPASVNGLNEYNLEIAQRRAEEFFRSALRLTQILQKDTRIDNMILALLGDFISGSIHDDIAENNLLGPTEALLFAQNLIASGIQFLLDNSTLNLTIPCHSGNHGRATKEQRMATENANSFEFLMYHALAGHFKDNKRVKFLISPSYHSYVNVYGMNIRFHHGHFLRYGGGVGGLFIPAYKGIANWNNGIRADLDCFGHFHQMVDGGSFICNGSLIGYNPYGLSIKGKFEKPQQVLFAVEKSRGRTCTWYVGV